MSLEKSLKINKEFVSKTSTDDLDKLMKPFDNIEIQLSNIMDNTYNYNAETDKDIKEYFDIRSKELILLGYEMIDLKLSQTCGVGTFVKDGKTFKSIYIRESYRGKGMFEELWKVSGEFKVLTLDECDIRDYLEYKEIPHVCEELPDYYRLIRKYYGDKKTKRSNVPYMNHIREGIVVLHELNKKWSKTINIFTESLFACYCLHPIYQNIANGCKETEKFKLIFMNEEFTPNGEEYAKYANAYLSTRVIDDLDDIEYPRTVEVVLSLFADKIQNYKDFMLYHQYTHKGRRRLFNYFQNWFDKFQQQGLTTPKEIETLINKIK